MADQVDNECLAKPGVDSFVCKQEADIVEVARMLPIGGRDDLARIQGDYAEPSLAFFDLVWPHCPKRALS